MLNVDNDLYDEVKMSIETFVLKLLFKNPLFNISIKYRQNKATVSLNVMYGSETWLPTNKQEDTFACLGRKILRAIIRPVRGHGNWRIRNNKELTELFGNENIVSAIKSDRLIWAELVSKMRGDRRKETVD